MKPLRLLVATLVLGLASLPAAAHHSYAMFNMSNTIALDARVVQFRWSNPHAFIRITVETLGGAEEWSIEMTSPNNLVQEGWTRRTLQSGDRVTLFVHPLRSGAQGGSYVGVRLADGRTLGEVN